LARIIWEFGEERYSRRIAARIVAERTREPIATTTRLAEIVRASVPRPKPGRGERIDPATRTFQALRIALNDELGRLERLLTDGWKLLRPGARMVVLSYHSLEDRLVKEAFRKWSATCHCPKEQPVCNCGWTPKVRPIVRKRQRPDPAEIARNPRARSAGLRAVERLAA
jgi:16S rRNA (cytosine1402-N4)-methyltransferase